MQKEHPCSREQFCKSFFGFRSRTAKRKSMKSGFGFLNWNPPWGRISRRWNPFSDFAFDCKIRNPDFPIERNPSIYSNNTRSSSSKNLYIKKSRLDIQKRAFSRVGAKIWMIYQLQKNASKRNSSLSLLISLKHDNYIDIQKIASALKIELN